MAAFLLPTLATGPPSLLAARNHAPSPVAGASRDSDGGAFPPSTSIGVAPVLAPSSASANASNPFFSHHQHHQHQHTPSSSSSSPSPPSPASFPLPPSLPLGSSLPPHNWDPVKVAVSPCIAPRSSSSSSLTLAHTVAASVGRLEKTRSTSESEPTSTLRHWAPSSSPSSPGVALAAAGFSSSTLSPAEQNTAAMFPDSDDGLRVACDRCLLILERCVPDLRESDRAIQEPSNSDEGGSGQRGRGIRSSTGRPPRREPGRPPCAACKLAQVPCEVGLSSPRRNRPHFDEEKIEMGQCEIDLPPPKQRLSPLPPPPHSASPLPGSSRPSAPQITRRLLPLSDASAAPPSGSTYDDAVDGRRPLFSPRDETPPLISPLSSNTAVVVSVASRASTTLKTMPADGRHPADDDDGDAAVVVDPTSWPAERTALLARVNQLEEELARLREGYHWLTRFAEAGAEEHHREKKRKLSGRPVQQHPVPAPPPPPPRSTSDGSASAYAPAPAGWSRPISQEPVPVPAQYPDAPPPGAAAAPLDFPAQLSVASTPSSTSRPSQHSPSSAVQVPLAHTFGLVTAPVTAPPPAALPATTTAYRASRSFSTSSSSATPSSAVAYSRPAGGVFSLSLASAFQPPPQSVKLPSPFPSQPSTAPTFTLPPSTGPLPSALSALPPAPFRRSSLQVARPPPPPPPAGAVAVRASSPIEMQEVLPSQQQKRLHLHAAAGPDSATTPPRLIPGAWMAPGLLGSHLPSSQPAVMYTPSPWTSAPLSTAAAAAVPVPPSYQHHPAPPPHQPPTQQRQQQHPRHPRLHQQQHSHHQHRPPSAPSLSSSSSTSAPHFHPYERRGSHDHPAPSPHQYPYQQQPPFDPSSSSHRRRDSAANASPQPPYHCERFVDPIQTRALPPQSAWGSDGPSPSDNRSSRHPSPNGSPPPLSHHTPALPPPPPTTTMGIRPVTASSTASSSTADSPAFPPWSVRASGTGTSASSPSSTRSVNSPVPMPKGGFAMAPGTKGSSTSAPASAPPRQKTSQHSIASLLGPAKVGGDAVSPPHLSQRGSIIGVGGCTPTRPTGHSAYKPHHRAHSGGYQESSIRDDRSGEEDIELEA